MSAIPPTPPQSPEEQIAALKREIERLKLLVAAGGNQEIADQLEAMLLAQAVLLALLGIPV